jgi:hypothetical protein
MIFLIIPKIRVFQDTFNLEPKLLIKTNRPRVLSHNSQAYPVQSLSTCKLQKLWKHGCTQSNIVEVVVKVHPQVSRALPAGVSTLENLSVPNDFVTVQGYNRSQILQITQPPLLNPVRSVRRHPPTHGPGGK